MPIKTKGANFFNPLINREAGCIVFILARPSGIWGASTAVEAFHMVCEFHSIPYLPRILAVLSDTPAI